MNTDCNCQLQRFEPFRADFVDTLQGQCFDTEKLELHVWQVVGIVGYMDSF